MSKRHLTIATRESPLALQQAELIKSLLIKHHPTLNVSFLGITTQADKMLEVSLTTIGGKGLFVKELEDALLKGQADIAVHSMKDVPMELPTGLCLPVMSQREEPRDVFVSNRFESLATLPRGAILGTSSLRRQTQLRAIRPDVEMRNLRGNINTRLNKLDKDEYDAIILAAAGLIRLQLTNRIRSYLPLAESLPAAGQGVLGIECREDDKNTQTLIAPLQNEASYHCVQSERAVCRVLGGGCQAPVAAFAQIHKKILHLQALVANRHGTRILRAEGRGQPEQAEMIGERVAHHLIEQGAKKILAEFI